MQKQLPQYIYKYVSINKYLYESLIRGELWFSSPHAFNDPFDSCLPINYSIESYKRTIGHELDAEYYKKEQQKIVRPMVFNNELEELRNKMGVCCFSSVNDNLIMWSHYADHHKGLVLKFDVAILEKYFTIIKKVRYTDKIDTVDYDESPEKIIKKLLSQKSTHWKTEKEIRIIVQEKGNYRFPQEALKEIRFGIRCDHHLQTNIMQLVKKFGYKDAVFSAFHIGNYTYKFDIGYYSSNSDIIGFQKCGDRKIKIPGLEIEI